MSWLYNINWLNVYLIGMAINALAIIISEIREYHEQGLYSIYYIAAIFFSLILWPFFDIMIIIKMREIYRKDK